MRRWLSAILIGSAFVAAGMAVAAIKPELGPKGPVREGPHTMSTRPLKAYRVHNVGTMWSATSNFGNYGDPNSERPSGEWPGGSAQFYLWEGRFWVGAIVGGEPRVSHADYGNYEFEPCEGSTFSFLGQKSILDSYVEFDDLTEKSGHTPIGLEIHQRGLSWSMPDYDDFIVYEYDIINRSGGTLNNVVVGWIFDCDVAAGPSGDASNANIDDLVDYDGYTGVNETNAYKYDIVDPLDLDGDGLTGYDEWGWAYADPKNPQVNLSRIEPDGAWDEFQIYQDAGGPPIHKQTNPSEFLIDSHGDTLHGWLLSRNMSYMYDYDNTGTPENDVGERNLVPPLNGFIGGRLIYTSMPAYREAPEDTMLRPYVHQWWNWESDPGSDREKYQYMTGTHPASLQMKFLPHPFQYGAGAPVFDYRFVHSTGPFMNLVDGDTIKCVFAYGVGWGIEGIRKNLDNAEKAYYSGTRSIIGDPAHPTSFASNYRDDGHFLLPIPPPIPELRYSAGNESVSLVWDDVAERTPDSFLGTVDFEGYKVYRSKYNASSWEVIYACDNKAIPTLIKDTDGNILNRKITPGGDTLSRGDPGYDTTTVFTSLLVNLPDIRHTFVDTGGTFLGKRIERPVNGLRYYYVVVAYDPDKMATYGLPSIESSRANYRKNTSGAPEAVIPIAGTSVTTGGKSDLSRVRVVPNPYRGSALFETRFEHKVFFHQPSTASENQHLHNGGRPRSRIVTTTMPIAAPRNGI